MDTMQHIAKLDGSGTKTNKVTVRNICRSLFAEREPPGEAIDGLLPNRSRTNQEFANGCVRSRIGTWERISVSSR